jgi:hypothetical protein
MNDGTPTGQRQGTDRPPTVTVSEAAAVLGISPDAVRGRLQRGTLAGQKIAGAWHVQLPPPVEATGHQQAIDGPPTGHQQDALGVHLEGEVAYLREQLDRALRQLEHERERADILQALGTGTTPETAQEAVESPRSDGSDPTGIRAWWRRLLGRDEM